MRSALLLLAAVFLFAGCATHSREQIAAVRAAGVSPSTVYKLEHDRVILPEDIIELRRRRVSDSVPIRHLQEVGVDYIPQRTDLRRMRAADVHAVVIDEVIIAGQRFASDRYDRPSFAWGLSIPFYSWYPYYGHGDYGWGYGGNYYGHYGHRDHHDHGHGGHHGRHH
jgi:hypothetical protein